MLKVNKTFEDLQILQELNEAWKEVGPRIKNYMESSVEIQLLQVRHNSFHLYKRDKMGSNVRLHTESNFLSLSFFYVRIC